MASTAIVLPDGRVLHAHADDDTIGSPGLLWHHGTPQSGALLPPVLDAARRNGLRLVSYGRPSYGGSTPRPGRDVASAAADAAAVLDAFGVDAAVSVGASGGGPHALACAALLSGRVTAALCLAGLAPLDGFDWADRMASSKELRAAQRGRAARAAVVAVPGMPPGFVDADLEALATDWATLGADAGSAGEASPDGMVDDDVAFAGPWGVRAARREGPRAARARRSRRRRPAGPRRAAA
nr:alpha/beta fold hydrolase [Cellulomonas sp. HZM]